MNVAMNLGGMTRPSGRIRFPLSLTFWLGPGMACTTALVLSAAAGNLAVVPITIQQTLDRAIAPDGTPRMAVVFTVIGVGAAVLLLTTITACLLNARLVRRSEALLDVVRTQAFRQIAVRPEVSAVPQSARVRRAVADIHQVSHFLRWRRPTLLASAGQLAVATAVMLWYSWELTVVVYLVMATLVGVQRWQHRGIGGRYLAARRFGLEVRAAIFELVVRSRANGAYAQRRRALGRADIAMERRTMQQTRLASRAALSQSATVLAGGAAVAVVTIGGA